VLSATVVERAVKFVDRHRGLTVQNKEVTMHTVEEEIQKVPPPYTHNSSYQFVLIADLFSL
jgi:hypothetical protein